MTISQFARSALIISTTPPIPREYGNRNRVFQTIEFLRGLGFKISFLLYAFDEEWENDIPPYYRELLDYFDYFATIPNSRRLHQQAADFHHGIDEWWDDTIGQQLTWLFQRRQFDVLFVNYTFFSRAFDYAPKNTLKILDTHDLFTGRRETFERYGVQPEFFYTNAQEETIAFNRSDAVIAIKESEAKFIRTLTTKHVVTIPYWDSFPVRKPAAQMLQEIEFSHDRPLRLGFIGAQNSVNTVNMSRFLSIFDRYMRLYNPPVKILIAGNVCRQLHNDYDFLDKLGRVAEISDFYENVDAIIAPLEFSTGIKIKVGEALVWGLPIFATHNAFDGFRSFHGTQTEVSVAALCRSVVALAYNEISYADLVLASRRAARRAQLAQARAFEELRDWIRNNMRRTALITERPSWYRSTFVDELIEQTVEYISHIAPPIILIVGTNESPPVSLSKKTPYLCVDDIQQAAALLMQASAHFCIAGAVLQLSGAQLDAAQDSLLKSGIKLWNLEIWHDGWQSAVYLRGVEPGAGAMVTTPLRYAPLVSNKSLSRDSVTVFRAQTMTDWELIVFDYLAASCAESGLHMETIEVPDYAEYDPAFFRRSMTDGASRLVLLTMNAVANLFILHAARFRVIDCIVITETFIFPQIMMDDGQYASVTSSIDQFLKDPQSGHTAPGANAGWDKLWTALTLTVSSDKGN